MQITRYKLRGVMLITTVVAVAAWILLAGGIFLTQSSQFQMLGARKIEEQARQYAEVDAQILKYVAYDKLTDATTLKSYKLHLKRAKMETVEAADWEDEITIGPEKKSSDKSGGYRVATINIYRKGDTKPRWSMDAILVKGAKNSSGSNTGEDPSVIENTHKYSIIVIPHVSDATTPEPRIGGFTAFLYKNTEKESTCFGISNFELEYFKETPPQTFRSFAISFLYDKVNHIAGYENVDYAYILNKAKYLSWFNQVNADSSFEKFICKSIEDQYRHSSAFSKDPILTPILHDNANVEFYFNHNLIVTLGVVEKDINGHKDTFNGSIYKASTKFITAHTTTHGVSNYSFRYLDPEKLADGFYWAGIYYPNKAPNIKILKQ